MKNTVLLLALIGFTAFSCNNEDTNKTAKKEEIQTPRTESDLNCFSKNDRDTIVLSYRSIGDSVSGALQYHISQKDKNTGSFYGRFNGDTLFVEYVFQSEGMDSRRQMAFLKKDNTLIQGFGPTAEQGNRQYFTDKSQLRFDSGIELKKTSCSN